MLQKHYVDTGKVRLIFRHYAHLGEGSRRAARAAVCAHGEGKFWAYHDRVFAAVATSLPDPLGQDNLIRYGEELGLPREAFAACMDSEAARAMVEADYRLGQDLGVLGTPMFIINGNKVYGYNTFSTFAEWIEQALQQP